LQSEAAVPVFKEQAFVRFENITMGTVYDMQALKAYVQGPSSQNKAEDTVVLNVSHSNLKQRFMELRFDMHVSDSKLSVQIDDLMHTLLI
jgi:hypothetical protein